MRTSRRTALLGIAALACLVSGIWWLIRRDDSFTRIVERGSIRIGYAVEAPFAMLDEAGQVTGESPATARLIVARLGIPKIEWVQMQFEDLTASLMDERIDAIAAGMFVTAERARLVSFSLPTVYARAGLLVQRGNPAKVPVFEDLAPGSSHRIAVLSGSVEQQRLEARGFRAPHLILVPDALAGRAATTQGIADALALSLPTLRWMAAHSSGELQVVSSSRDLEARSSLKSVDRIAFAFRPRDRSLRAAWNAAQREIIGSSAHLQAIAPFGFERSDVAAE